jgi:hypothetical protein
MLKVMALLRTVFLVFIVVVTIQALTFTIEGQQTFEQQCRVSVLKLRNVAWYAIGWIAFEVAVGWWLATRAPRSTPLAPATPAGAPPKTDATR